MKVIPFVYNLPPDTRVQKAMIAIYLALLIGLFSLYKEGFKTKSKFILIFIGYCLVVSHLWWKQPLVVNDITTDMFWVWIPLCKIFCFFLMFLGVSNIKFRYDSMDIIIQLLGWSGFIMAVYVLSQQLGQDPIFVTKEKFIGSAVTNPQLGGTLGSSTIVAAFIAITTFFTLGIKKWWSILMALFQVGIVVMTMAWVSISALFVGLCVYFSLKLKNIVPIILLVVVGIGVLITVPKERIISEGNGRFSHWKTIVQDINNGQIKGDKKNYSYFGLGLGTFGYVYHTSHPTNDCKGCIGSGYQQAHNDPLEVLYTLGYIGFALYILMNLEILFYGMINVMSKSDYSVSLLCAFICASIISLGLFIYQLGVFQFYMALTVGLIYNKYLLGEER